MEAKGSFTQGLCDPINRSEHFVTPVFLYNRRWSYKTTCVRIPCFALFSLNTSLPLCSYTTGAGAKATGARACFALFSKSSRPRVFRVVEGTWSFSKDWSATEIYRREVILLDAN